MNDLRKQVILDLLVTPTTVVPLTLGVSLLLLSVVMGSGWGLIGFLSCLVGLGALVTNFLFNLEDVTKRALARMIEQEKAKRNTELDALDAMLASDRDPRDQTALRNLRGIYDSFMDDVKEGKISSSVPQSMYQQIENIFNGCVLQLKRQHEIWQTSRKVQGELKEGLLKQKSDILDEVEASVESLADVVNEVRALGLKAQMGELNRLQERLQTQLEAAKATDQLAAELEKGKDLSRFAEYEK